MSLRQSNNCQVRQGPSSLSYICGQIQVIFLVGLMSFAAQAAADDMGKAAVKEEVTERAAQSDCNNIVMPELVKWDADSYEYQGLTETGMSVLTAARDTLRLNHKIMSNEIRNMETIYRAGSLARLGESHMILYGPPGGAKSMLVDFLNKANKEEAFTIQGHQMQTEQPFVGMQNPDASLSGRGYEHTVEGSMVRSKVAKVDEIDKFSPMALAPLLGIMNEGEAQVGGQTIKADTETVYSTSNANLPEIFQQFFENGEGSTAPALLNRFQFKSLVYNWLSPEDQALLDQRRKRQKYLAALKKMNPDAVKDEIFEEPGVVDWEALRLLARTMFKTSDLFDRLYIEFVNDMRKVTNDAIKASEEQHHRDRENEPFVYFPAADLTERLRQIVPEIVIMDAFLDFLHSPLADDKSLKNLSDNPIELGPESLWRAYLIMTTLGPGETKLVFDEENENELKVDWGWTVDVTTARDKREEKLIENIKAEQRRFQDTLTTHLKEYQENIELRTRHAMEDDPDLDSASFEILMMGFNRDD